jgi:Rab5-interacting Rab5ip-like protein
MKSLTPPPFDKLYWLRVGLGVVAGLLAGVIPGTDFYNGVSLGILVYLISYYFARYSWFKGVDKQFQGKIYTTGLAVYIGLFIFTWILLFTQASA